MSDMTPNDFSALVGARALLENPGLAAKATNLLGAPIEMGFEALPDNWREKVGAATETALRKALSVAVQTMGSTQVAAPSDRWHMLAVAISGALCGAAGLTALPIELPISTTITLRYIADIARSEIEDVNDVGTAVARMEVFALGARSPNDDANKSAYFAAWAMLARSVTEAAQYIAKKGIVEEGASAVVRLIASIASRFGVTVSEKAAAHAVPVIGAAGGRW